MFAREVVCLNIGFLCDQDWSVSIILTFPLDATGVAKKDFFPVVENVTVATKEAGRPKPQRQDSTHPLAYQQRHNVIYVRGKRKAGYRYLGETLNPCEKAWMANGWVISTWTKPGELRCVYCCLFRGLGFIIV